MNIIEYSKRFGKYSFKERQFISTDAAVFVFLSYANFDKIIPSIVDKKDGISIGSLSDDQIYKILPIRTFNNSIKEILNVIRDQTRYKNIIVENPMSVIEADALEQFFAVTFNIPDVGYFVSFRGTDGSVVGWKENFATLYNDATLAQIDAIEYLEQLSSIHPNEKFILGGHSKGANLSMFSLLYGSNKMNETISKVYSFDGYGFINKNYKKVSNWKDRSLKIEHIVPEQSVIGELFYIPTRYTTIKANEEGLNQHNPLNWIIDDNGHFVTTNHGSFNSRLFHRIIRKWSQCSSKDNYQIFSDVIIKSLQNEDGDFKIHGKDSKGAIKKILQTINKQPVKIKSKFFWMTFMLGWISFTSFIYYLIKYIGIFFSFKWVKQSNC